jgi:4-guanidinobutyraldehyde dehydrogenase/NAD-dependent aldehyde dehydrogenase
VEIGPALAAGNSLILKPSEKSPLSAIRIASLAAEAGIPDGVFNVLPGFGHTAGQALALHMDVDCVAFTGSTRTGKLMLQYSAQSNMKRVWLECGGKSPNIILADCPDLDRAAEAAASAIFFNQGEMCSAGSRLIVEEPVREAVVERVAAAGRRLLPGDPLDPETRLGAIVDQTQLSTVLGYIDSGREEGARLRVGGNRTRADSGGYYVEPTVFDQVRPDMKIAREEIFGPVLATIGVRDAEEALAVGNSGVYGSPRRCGRATSAARIESRARCAPASSMSTATTPMTSRCRSAATSSPAWAATNRCTPSTSTPSSRRPGSTSPRKTGLDDLRSAHGDLDAPRILERSLARSYDGFFHVDP